MAEGTGSVERLCEMLSHRDATIQRLEEDLLRIRMVGEANMSAFFFCPLITHVMDSVT